MADDTAEAKPEEQKPKSKLPMKTLMVILGVILLEGGTIGVFWKMKGGPEPAEATDPIAETQENPNKDVVEVVIIDDMSADNYKLGKTRMVISFQVAAKAQRSREQKLMAVLEQNAIQIKDSVRVLVSDADPAQIRDGKLEVIKREIKTGVERIIGEGYIEEILLPQWQSYNAD